MYFWFMIAYNEKEIWNKISDSNLSEINKNIRKKWKKIAHENGNLNGHIMVGVKKEKQVQIFNIPQKRD